MLSARRGVARQYLLVFKIPQLKPEITVESSNSVITPPEIKVIRPIPLSTYKMANPTRERKNTFSNIAFDSGWDYIIINILAEERNL